MLATEEYVLDAAGLLAPSFEEAGLPPSFEEAELPDGAFGDAGDEDPVSPAAAFEAAGAALPVAATWATTLACDDAGQLVQATLTTVDGAADWPDAVTVGAFAADAAD